VRVEIKVYACSESVACSERETGCELHNTQPTEEQSTNQSIKASYLKGHRPAQQLVHQTPQLPHIHFFIVVVPPLPRCRLVPPQPGPPCTVRSAARPAAAATRGWRRCGAAAVAGREGRGVLREARCCALGAGHPGERGGCGEGAVVIDGTTTWCRGEPTWMVVAPWCQRQASMHVRVMRAAS